MLPSWFSVSGTTRPSVSNAERCFWSNRVTLRIQISQTAGTLGIPTNLQPGHTPKQLTLRSLLLPNYRTSHKGQFQHCSLGTNIRISLVAGRAIFCRMRSALRIASPMHISRAGHGLSPISASLRAARMVAENRWRSSVLRPWSPRSLGVKWGRGREPDSASRKIPKL